MKEEEVLFSTETESLWSAIRDELKSLGYKEVGMPEMDGDVIFIDVNIENKKFAGVWVDNKSMEEAVEVVEAPYLGRLEDNWADIVPAIEERTDRLRLGGHQVVVAEEPRYSPIGRSNELEYKVEVADWKTTVEQLSDLVLNLKGVGIDDAKFKLGEGYVELDELKDFLEQIKERLNIS